MTKKKTPADENSKLVEAGEAVTIDAPPKEGQRVINDGIDFTTVKEGLAHILIRTNAPTGLNTKDRQEAIKERKTLQSQTVFYNPIQQFNRDLSVLAIKAYSEHVIAFREQKARRQRRKGRGGKSEKQNGAAHETARSDSKENETSNGNKRKAGQALSQDDHDAPETKKTKQTESGSDDEAEQEAQAAEPPQPSFVNTHDSHQETHLPKKPFRILDALSATGLRALRYASEIPEVTSVTANDVSPEAIKSIKANIHYNRLTEKIEPSIADAKIHMYTLTTSKYDVIDLDPYGTAVPFLDAAVHALNDGGLLCVTCTDSGIFASNGYPEKTFSSYGGNPIKGRHGHEGGIRLILNAIATTAARDGISIEPLMSLSIDFYIRVFVRVRRSPEQVKFLAGKTMLVYNCDSGCGAFETQLIGKNAPYKTPKAGKLLYKFGMAQGPSADRFCAHCGLKTHLAGPMWAGPLHNPLFLRRILSYVPDLDESVYGTKARIEGMVTTALGEMDVEDYSEPELELVDEEGFQDTQEGDERLILPMYGAAVDRHPFFFCPSSLAGVIHSRAPGEAAVRGALKHAGYRATRSHTCPGSIRTNAPWSFIWEMMREWVRQKAPLKEGALKPNTAGYNIIYGKSEASEATSEDGEGQNEKEVQDGAVEHKDDNDESAAVSETIRADSESHQHSANGGDAAKKSNKAREIVFDEALGKEKSKGKLVRYQINPRENWGPMNRAGH